jgi:hypothetical protein
MTTDHLGLHKRALALIVVAVAGCTPNHPGSTAPTPATTTTSASAAITAQATAERIKAAVPEVTQLIAITGDNDANNMIGRVNGYTAATVLVDPRATTAGGECDLFKSRASTAGPASSSGPMRQPSKRGSITSKPFSHRCRSSARNTKRPRVICCSA